MDKWTLMKFCTLNPSSNVVVATMQFWSKLENMDYKIRLIFH